MTQHQLVIEYCKIHGEILPAKMAGTLFMGKMFGSETSKRCRELRNPLDKANPYKRQILGSRKEGKFEVFYLVYSFQPEKVEQPQDIFLDFTQMQSVQRKLY